MPFLPVLVLGGLRSRAATFFNDWVMECADRCRAPRSGFGVRRPTEALMASVIDSGAASSSLTIGNTAVARPDGLIDGCNLFRCRAISLRLRDTAAGLQ